MPKVDKKPKTILRKKANKKNFKKVISIPDGYTTIYDESDDCEKCDFSRMCHDADGILQQKCMHPSPANSGCQDNKIAFKRIHK